VHNLTLSAGSAGQPLPLIRTRRKHRMTPRAAVRLEYQSSDIVAADVPVLLYRQVNNLCESVSLHLDAPGDLLGVSFGSTAPDRNEMSPVCTATAF
jgi:hypothetical protein